MDSSKSGEPYEKVTAIGKYSWPQVTKWLLMVLVLYAIGSLFISNPFWEVRPNSPINYSHTMYLHGLTIGLAGLVSLVASQLFEMSNRVRKSILICTVAAIILGVTAGAFNRSIDPPNWLHVQVVSFFALDVVLISQVLGFIFTKNVNLRRTLTYWVGLFASISFLIAAVTGDIAGWILEFGNWPHIVGWWAKLAGEKVSDLQANLIMSHSHEIVVSILALLVTMFSWKYGRQLTGVAAIVKRVGEWFVLIGTIVMTIMYVLAGFGGASLQSPTLIVTTQSRVNGPNGLMLIDFVTGVGIMVGGLIVVGAIALGRRINNYEVSKQMKTAIYSISLTWLLLVLTMVGLGYSIEVDMVKYGGPLAANGAAFMFLHQDIIFFLFPALMVVMILVQHWLSAERGRIVNILLRSSVVLCFLGAMVYVLVTPSLLGPGYWIIALGFLFIIISMVYFFVYGSYSAQGNLGITEDQMRSTPSEH